VIDRRPPPDLAAMWLIARRAAVESMQDRLTLLMSMFFAVVLPIGIVVLVLRPQIAVSGDSGDALAFYLLAVGLAPAVSAVGIAAGQFAGEKERGLLTPLLASPASNLAIFGGKVLGSVIPPLLYTALAEAVYLSCSAVVLGPAQLLLLPPLLSIGMVVLVPAITVFAAITASLISSRVRTFNAAQQIGGIVLMPVWGVIIGVAVKLSDWGPAALFAAIALLVLLDVGLTILAAATWRREDVLSSS
jgi:ABC-2 type transport system permease protein